jgi:hypothetical protein
LNENCSFNSNKAFIELPIRIYELNIKSKYQI